MSLDHLSFGTHDITTTRAFYEGQLAFMQWQAVPGVPSDYDSGINHDLAVPRGTFHFAFRCPSVAALEARRRELP